MLIPDYWAEARKQHRSGNRQITVRRFGWSVVSEADAVAMAESRAEMALSRLRSGEKLERQERKTAYNGAFGLPIREEVLSRHGEEVITRNSYGAHCLNTPRAVFADIDFSDKPSTGQFLTTFVLLVVVLLATYLALASDCHKSWAGALGILLLSCFFMAPLSICLHRVALMVQGGHERISRKRLRTFLSEYPAWNVRLYRTPGGLRLLATHQPFQPADHEVQKFFSSIGADPIYVRMCQNQQCFRARLTAKPWRIGIGVHMRPRPGVWPVRPDMLPIREKWITEYERSASSYAACRFIGAFGSGVVHHEIGAIIELHDREARANDLILPIA